MIRNLLFFAAAATLDIAGCFAFWLWLRRGAPAVVALLGAASLVGLALALTRIESPFAGRAYAAYGGVYIAASLAWLWAVEGQRPTVPDWIGAAVAIVGAVTITRFEPHTFFDGGDKVFVLITFDATAQDKNYSFPNNGHLWQGNAAGKVVKYDHVTDTAQMIRMAKGE